MTKAAIALALIALAVFGFVMLNSRRSVAEEARQRMIERCDRLAQVYDVDLKKCYRQALRLPEPAKR
jgi:hypothetical protein